MSFFNFYHFPNFVIVADNPFDQIQKILNNLRIKKNTGILADEKTWEIAGNKLEEILKESNYSTSIFLIKEPSISEAHNLIGMCNEKKLELLFGVGGGSVIDVTKYTSSKLKIPYISIPTIASHDGIASPIASLKGTNFKESYAAKPPDAIIVDLDIIAKSPLKFSISGCADVLSNYSAVLDWQLASRLKGEKIDEAAKGLSLLAYEMIKNNITKIQEKSKEGFEILIKSLINSSLSMCIAGNSRPASGAEHLISHSLDRVAENPMLHGLQCGMASIITLYLHDSNWKEFRAILKKLGAPVTLSETSLKHQEMIKAMTMAHTIRDRYTILSDTGLSEQAAEKALRITEINNIN